jgi:biotin operon repressor
MKDHGSVDRGRSASVIARRARAVARVSGAHEISPTAQALLALEAIQNIPGITAQRLGERLGVTERAARRYVAILREAGLPIESVSARGFPGAERNP